MIVPKQYVQAAPRRAQSTEFSEKSSHRSTQSPSNSPRARSALSSSLFRSRESSPTKSPAGSDVRQSLVRLQPQRPEPQDVPHRTQPVPVQKEEAPRFRRESVKDVLSATAIPIRRKKPGGRVSQRLPRGDHVSNFSSLLMDDLKSTPGGIPRSNSNASMEGLFGHMDELLEEGQMYVGSEGLDAGVLSQRSPSDDSLVSLSAPDDFTASDRNSQHSSTSTHDRKVRHVAASEDCSHDHPLSVPEESPDFFNHTLELSPSPSTRRRLPGRSDKKPRQSLKSSLTASLKALKSAAQSVSTRTPSEAADRRARSFFDFDPTLTDDRRPPLSLAEPNADLRRYLNPPPQDSAAQLHFWQDHRHSNFEPKLQKESRKQKRQSSRSPSRRGRRTPGENPLLNHLPPVVQLASCLPSSIRTEHASSPPIWLTADGIPVNKHTAVPLLFDPNANNGKGEPVAVRHREPRENRDFLRVFVCEMEMRRSGKLSEDLSVGRARLWLPPVGTVDRATVQKKEGDVVVLPSAARAAMKKAARERLMCQSIEDI